MTKEELIKFVNAGFSKEEIFSIFKDETPAETPKETPAETPKDGSKEEPNILEFPSNGLDAMTEGISKALIDAIQKNNILNSSQREEKPIASEDIIANVLDLFEKEN